MAPPPEYDKEPKAPDKSLLCISKDDSKVRYTNNIKDQSPTSEVKSTNSKTNSDAENKHVETLDEGQLRALLNEAITYKCPKDREGKSSLFKELLEEAEQDEQCEAAARVSGRGWRGRGRREHHSSLQDLVAAMAAESAPRRHTRHAPAHPPPASVSARAHHGGSLPSGVDTSFLLSEEPARGGYLATVRCVNPPPLAERRVSASDANPPAELDLLTRRSKPIFPMTYTARATLEIGSGSVSSGRAVTTTTASNQVRTPRRPLPPLRPLPTAGPPEKLYGHRKLYNPKTNKKTFSVVPVRNVYRCKRIQESFGCANYMNETSENEPYVSNNTKLGDDHTWNSIVNNWYDSFNNCASNTRKISNNREINIESESIQPKENIMAFHNITSYSYKSVMKDSDSYEEKLKAQFQLHINSKQFNINNVENNVVEAKTKYRNITEGLVPPSCSLINKRNIRSLTIGTPINFRDPTESSIKIIETIESSNQKDPKPSQLGPNSRKKRKVKSKLPSTKGYEHNSRMLQKKCKYIPGAQSLELDEGTAPTKLSNDKDDLNVKECKYHKLKANNQDPEITSTGPAASEHREAIAHALAANTADSSTGDSIPTVHKLSQEIVEKNALPRSKIDFKEVSPTFVEVDSAIPFSCITTPEIVSSCNTTTSTTQSDAVDQKQPRSVISSNFNGLPLTRPNYGSTASTTDEYKVPILTVHYRLQKSLDENGNAVQGFNSPLSGSSQHKKPRRKKSSKNETVIKSHQIDGYQGNKDLNEVLRFIESNADGARANKLGRAKHKDDSDEKCTKKRSTERRKDKENKIKRATSMEELSRTKLEDLTDTDPPLRAGKTRGTEAAPAKPERRSWGDDARAALLMRPDPLADTDAVDPAAELTDFQTVTKKRKPRRRTDEAEREPAAEPAPRRRPPSPRARRISAPPSDRSNDSNDDMDSVHSLPAEAPRARIPPPVLAPAPLVPPVPPLPAPHASYADIARTRHNIPDLIESCNFYAEGEAESTGPARAARTDSEYPALAGGRRARDKVAGGAASEAPAPDVVADRRPPVVLLAAGARARELDGVTFGFDVNEQLLGGARADVVRDAEAVGVSAGCAALRYLPPPAPPAAHTHLIVDFVQAAWEDIMKCGSGKVKYYSD